MKYKTLADTGDIAGKKVLVRFDYNVPIQDGKVVDDFRIKQSFPTIDLLREKKAKIIIIVRCLKQRPHVYNNIYMSETMSSGQPPSSNCPISFISP